MDISELMELLDDEQKKEIAQVIFDRLLEEVKEIDIKKTARELVNKSVEYAFDECIDYEQVGYELTDIVVEKLKGMAK